MTAVSQCHLNQVELLLWGHIFYLETSKITAGKGSVGKSIVIMENLNIIYRDIHSCRGLVLAQTLYYFSGLEGRCGIKDTTHMALSGGGFSMIPHEILSLYPENSSAFILQTALYTKT